MVKRRPAIFVLSAVVAGIVLADNIHTPSWLFLFAALLTLVPAAALYFKGQLRAAGVSGLLCLLILSAFNYSFRFKTYPPGHIIHYVDNERRLTVFGAVDDWPAVKKHRTEIVITVDSIAYEGKAEKALGGLLINLNMVTTRYRCGDRIYFDARLYSIIGGPNPSGFDYRRYLNLKGVFAVAFLPNDYGIYVNPASRGNFYRIVDGIRQYITDTFKRNLDTNSAALASGFLIGDTKDIPPDIYELFRDSGTLHILAVSGSNVGLVVLIFVLLLKVSPLKTTSRTILLLLVIFLFTFLAYNQPSVVRASVMASLVLIGKALQRKIDLNNIIATTALIILLVEPTQLFDVGFQLSFVTAWGLVFFVPTAAALFRPWHTRLHYRIIILPLLVCIIAQLVSLPMSAFHFQRMPMISFISNLVIVPMVSIVVVGQLILLLGALILPLIGNFFGAFLNPLINVTLRLIEHFGSDNLNMLLSYKVTAFSLVLYYIMLTAISFSLFSKRARRLLILYMLLLANGVMALGVMAGEAPSRFTVFSVPKGIVAVNRAAEARAQVILCDLPSKEYSIAEKIIEPYLESRGIACNDIIALTGECSTLRETSRLLSRIDSSRAYIPAKFRNLFMDMRIVGGMVSDSEMITCYPSSPIPDELAGKDIFLSDGLIIYAFDSSAVALVADNDRLKDVFGHPAFDDIEILIVKPLIEKKDLALLNRTAEHNIQVVVCNKVSRQARMLLEGESGKVNAYPNIIVTSYSGAVEIVIENGRALLIR
jgi:competence protein ComEC